MGEPASKPQNWPAQYEEVLALPENVVGEIVDGTLYVSARPAKPHTLSASRLGALLVPPFDMGIASGGGGGAGPGGWWILFEPELHFWRDGGGARWREVLVPDLAGWRRERLPSLADGEAAFTLAPDWVCEVSSPSTAALDRMRKMSIYRQEGVRHAWIVDPDTRLLEVYRLEGDHWVQATVVGGKQATARLEPFETLALELPLLWLPEEARAEPPARR